VAKAKQSPQDAAVEALSRSLVDPTPRPLMGTRARPGIFLGSSQAVKAAAALSVENGWLALTGEKQGKGKTAKDLYRITPAGIEYALQHSEALTLLQELLGASDALREALRSIQGKLDEASQGLNAQNGVLGQLRERVSPPDLSAVLEAAAPVPGSPTTVAHDTTISRQTDSPPDDATWLAAAVDFLRDYRRRNPQQRCPLPELYRHVSRSNSISIGRFHDGLRQLVREQRIALHPYTGPMYQLKDEQYALLLGQEIKFYADIKQ